MRRSWQGQTDTQRKMYRIASSTKSTYDEHGNFVTGVPTIYDTIRKNLNVDFKGNHMPADLRGEFTTEGILVTVLSAAEKPTLTRVKMT